MAKWYGTIGFAETIETSPGIWEEVITERNYYGQVHQTTRRTQSSGQMLDNIDVTNRISILADPFVEQNSHLIRYLTFMGTRWEVSSIELKYPRLALTVGGVYNGPKASTS